MHFRSGQRACFAWLMLLIATASAALGDELSLLNTAKPEIQQQIADLGFTRLRGMCPVINKVAEFPDETVAARI